MEDITACIIYYTSNREEEAFEQKIRANILKHSGGLQIISVSQKPIDFGENICVGDVGVSGFNMFRQVQKACQACRSRFVISVEADCVYPPDYFSYRPKRDDVPYRDTNLYVMGDHRTYWFHKKEGATHAQIVGRKYYLEVLEKLFKGAPKWSTEEKNFPKERHRKEDIFDKVKYFRTKNPVFQIKTHRSMRYYTSSSRIPVHSLPFWGEGEQIRAYYMKGIKEKYVSE